MTVARRRLRRPLAALGGLVIALTGAEIGCRLAGLGGPLDTADLVFDWRPGSPYGIDADLGVRLLPGFRGQMVYLSPDTGVVVRAAAVRTNAIGLRGPEVSGPVDVLAVGDSVTFGQGVAEDETWPARLAASTGEVVVNAGVPWWNLEQEARWLARHVEEVRPRRIVVAWFANDLDPAGLVGASTTPAVPLPASEWRRRTPSRPSWAWTWVERLLARRERATAVLDGWADYRDHLAARDADPVVRAAQRDAFGRIAGAARAVGADVLVVTIPLVEVADDPGVARLVAHAAADAGAAGLPVVDAAAAVADVPLERRVVCAADPHPGPEAHAAIAGVVTRALAAPR